MKTLGDLIPEYEKEQREAEKKSPKHISEPIEFEDYTEISCWLCGNDDAEEMEECGECGRDTCGSCGEWKDGSFVCHNCLDDMVEDEH